MIRTFSSRIAAYFGALFLMAMGAMFFLWYYGLPQLGLRGASGQWMVAAMRDLESAADAQRAQIMEELTEARGDVLVLAESPMLARQLASADPALQKDFERRFDTWRRAYPDRYRGLFLLDPASGRVRAAGVAGEGGRTFGGPDLVRRAVQPGITELIEQIDTPDGAAIVILRQVYAQAAGGDAAGRLVGVLVVIIDPRHLADAGRRGGAGMLERRGVSLLFDATGRQVGGARGGQHRESFTPGTRVAAGFEGTLLETDADGRELLVTYRHLQLVGANGWRLVHFASRDEVLADLQGRANKLIVAGLLLTLLALALVSLAARRVTRPLRALAEAARRLGAGHLDTRAFAGDGETREITALADAFNGMARNIQQAQETLEASVLERTAELQRSETRHSTLFESMVDAVVILQAGRLIDCNPAALKIFGTSREDILGRHPAELSPPLQGNGEDSFFAAQRQVEKAMREGSTTFEWLHRRMDTGASFDAEVTLSPMAIDGEMAIQGTVRDITERKRAEAEVIDARNRLQAMLGAIPDLLFEIGLDTRIHDWHFPRNASLGLTPDMFLGRKIAEVIHRKAAAVCKEALLEAAEVGWSAGREVSMKLPQGERWFELYVAAKPASDPDDRRFIVIASDVTLRKQAVIDLDERNKALRAIVDNFPGGISLFDAELRMVIFNRQAMELLDFPDELINRQPLLLEDMFRYNAQRGEYGPGDVEEIVRRSMERARRFEAHRFERVRPNGLALEVRGAPMPGGGFVTFYIDITERKLAEKALRESEEMFRAVAQSANDAIITADSSGCVIRWNKGAEAIFGHVAAEAIGLSLTVLMPERFRAPHLGGMQRVAAGGEPHVMGKPVELVGLRRDGREFPLELSLAQWQVPEGRFFTGVIRDITERKNIERQLEDQKAHLEDLVQQRTHELTEALQAARLADQTKDAFLANMSHELRTPLNAVIGMAGLARAAATDARQRDYLEKIVGAGSNLNRTINDLLDLSKIAAGHMEFETIAFSLRGLFERCRSVMEHRATEKGLQLDIGIDAAVPDILLGDPHRVEQILLNLLGNAIKFTHSGRVSARVALDGNQDGRVCLRIEVEDTGIGMRSEVLGRLFTPFSQADSTVSRQFGGSGLGLAISRRLAEMMDGDIAVSSSEGSGTTFTVRLWLRIGAHAELPAAMPAQQDLPSGYRNVRLLVAEDQPLNREIVEALLAEVGIVPRMAQNGQEALDILTAAGPGAFDLVLMDIQMPLMDGLTATRELRCRPGFETLPIIAMTAHTMAHEKEISATAGMNDHIGKPFDNENFYRTLAKWIPADRTVVSSASGGAADGSASVAAKPELASLRGVNVESGLARFGGRDDRYRHWLGDFLASAGSVPGQVRNEVAAGRFDEAAKAAHAFKGRVGMLGMEELHGQVSALELALRDSSPAEELLAVVEQAVAEMKVQLVRVLEAGSPSDTVLEKLSWRDEFSVGVPEMDAQHKRLVDMLNQLAESGRGSHAKSSGAVHRVLSAMFDYTERHFKDEEDYLRKIGYPQLEEHEKEHEAFVRKMIGFNLAAADGVINAAAVHAYLKDWLLSHIVSSDKQYGHFVAQRGS